MVRLAGDCGIRRCLVTCRLTGQQKAGQVCTYTLDGVGNLKTMWEGGNFPKTFTHDAADKIVTMIEGSNLTTYTWTGYGALASEITGTATTDYSYNGQDQLVLVTPPGDGFPTTYAFDGDGLRRSIQTTNVNQDPPTLDITTVVWDGSDYLLLNGPSSDTVVLTLGGEIVSSGSTDLLPDSLGSVIGDIRSGQDPRVPFSYWPYGTMLLSVVQPSFPFLFVGSLGYYYDAESRDYARAREYYKKLARWFRVDPIWPRARPYSYGFGNPILLADPSGRSPCLNVDADCNRFGSPFNHYPEIARSACEKLVRCLRDPKCKASLTACLSKYGCRSSMLDSMKKHCDGTHCVDVWCCKQGCCGCDGDQWASAKQGSWLFNCGIRLCYNFTTNPNPCAVFLHEVSHCAGTDDMDEENQDGCNAQNIEICMRDYVC